MKVIDEQASPELVNLQPMGQPGACCPIPIAPADCADDAPC